MSEKMDTSTGAVETELCRLESSGDWDMGYVLERLSSIIRFVLSERDSAIKAQKSAESERDDAIRAKEEAEESTEMAITSGTALLKERDEQAAQIVKLTLALKRARDEMYSEGWYTSASKCDDALFQGKKK